MGNPGREQVEAAIAAFQSGVDRDAAFRLLFDAYYRPLQRFFARKGLAPEVCLDLTQETFLGIYQGLGSYRPEARFEAWLYRIATTTHLKWLRARSAEKRTGEELPAEETGEVAVGLQVEGRQLAEILSDEQQRALRQAVGGLPAQMRRCLSLRLFHEMSYQEIAAVLKISIETVKAHLFQGRQKLRQELSGLAPGGLQGSTS